MNHKYVYILPFLVITGCDITKPSITTYDDCIIDNINESSNEKVVEIIKTSCKKKFPVIFDFEEIAKKANVITWKEVAISDRYKKLSDEEKVELRESYFVHVIEERVHPDFKAEAKTNFVSYAWGIANEIQINVKDKTKETGPTANSESKK